MWFLKSASIEGKGLLIAWSKRFEYCVKLMSKNSISGLKSSLPKESAAVMTLFEVLCPSFFVFLVGQAHVRVPYLNLGTCRVSK